MIKLKQLINYFTKFELTLWIASIVMIILFYIAFDKSNYIALIASLIGATSLIFNAKGNPFGQLLMIKFSCIYGYISITFAYYGEMITYLGMCAPMALLSLISWKKNPYSKEKSEVKVNKLKLKEIVFMIFLSLVVTVVFYFILKYFNTTNLIFSTISVTTSFIAAYLTFRRSAFYAIAYATNDIILIVLWTMATFENTAYVSVVVCFVAFLLNDLYGFINWRKMHKIQNN